MQHPARQYAVPVVRQLLHQLDLVGDAAQVGGPGGAAPLKGLREAGEPGVGGVARSVQHAGLGQHHGDEAHVPGGLFLDTWEVG
jgi:hypothetical protein